MVEIQDDIQKSIEERLESQTQAKLKRANDIAKAGLKAVILNLIFALIKGVIGVTTHSVAIVSDAFSSVSEAAAAVITVLGAKISVKNPDKDHPGGYGRVEYIAGVLVAVISIVAGWKLMETSIERIFHPSLSSVDEIEILLVALTILGKYYLYRLDTKEGKAFHAEGLLTSARSDLLACFTTGLTVLSAVFAHYFKIDIDGWVGLVISFMIMGSGFYGFKRSVSTILGCPVPIEFQEKIELDILQFKPILGVYDLFLNNTGAGNIRGTVRVTVPDDASALEVYKAISLAEETVLEKYSIFLTIGIVATNTHNPENQEIAKKVIRTLAARNGIVNVYGVEVDPDEKHVDVHVSIDVNQITGENKKNNLIDVLTGIEPNYTYKIFYNFLTPDTDTCRRANEKINNLLKD